MNVHPIKRRASLLAALLCVAAIDNPAVAGISVQIRLRARLFLVHRDQPNNEFTAQSCRTLSSGSEAMLPLHGLQNEEENKDTLTPAISGMECYIDRILTYVLCYSPRTGSEKEADLQFSLIVGELQVALPPDRWIGMKREPGVESIRSHIYQDHKHLYLPL